MQEDEDSNIFAGIDPEDGGPDDTDAPPEGGAGSVELPTEEQLRSMDGEELRRNAVQLLELCRQLKDDNEILDWELREYKDSLTYFSSAAKLAHKLNASDVETIASIAINEMPEYFSCRFGALFFYNQADGLFELYRSSSPSPESIRRLHVERDATHFLIRLFFTHGAPFLAEYNGEGNLLVADNDEQMVAQVPDDWFRILGRKAIVFPLRINSAEKGERLVLGGLLIGDAKRELEAKDAEVAIVFADLLSSSLYNARLVQRLNEMTTIDALTGIHNRRHLIDRLDSAMAQARRYGHKLSIAMLDIDHFKRLNDAFGHLCGDEVLRGVASILTESVRADVDVAARYGGEEFMLLMPYTGLEHAREVAERVRKKIEVHSFLCEGQIMSVTCSIGVAEYVADESLEKFVDRADVALYDAKNSGRNRVCSIRNAIFDTDPI